MIGVAVGIGMLLARIGAFVAFLPLLGGQPTPRLVKMGLTLGLAWCFFADGVTVPPALRDAESTIAWPYAYMLIARELALGGILGYVMGLFLLPAKIAGELMSQEMGMTFGSLVSPSSEGASSPLASLFEMIAGAMFLTFDGHHLFFATLAGSFRLHPAGESIAIPMHEMTAGLSAAEEAGLILAGPAILCLFLTTVCLAFLSRLAPQWNLYTVGFPARVLIGLLAAITVLPQMLSAMSRMFGRFADILAWAR
ncbi:MAG: flagellar biosynthetic protein FliR [Gemmataceae bacterium]|nr:flagellar biosynthetic protein FliR [Gemmataceae bacterium]